jgi:all-trans-retinol 13,14-reductase
MTKPDDRPWGTHAPEGPWDYIVLGSGMGGMTTAALLARLGRRVLVLERHYIPGGFTHAFRRKRWHWDVGVHAIGEVSDRALLGRVLGALAGDRLRWASLGPVYERFHYPEGFTIEFPDNPRTFRENLCAAFPHEVRAIDGYLAAVRSAVGALRGYYLSRALPEAAARLLAPFTQRGVRRHTQVTLRQVLDGLTDNPRLKTVLSGQWGYYGSPPSEGSFAIHAGVVHHFLRGAYYPVGGAGSIARALLGTVAEAGGWTRIRADVEQILVERGAAVGVRLVGGEVLRARRVVSAASAQVTATKLLPPAHRGAWTDAIAVMPPSPAHVCAYLGLEGDARAAGGGSANQWFWETWDAEQTAWDFAQPDLESPVLYTSYPSLKDPSHDAGPSQVHTAEVVTFVPYQAFARWRGTRWQRRPEDYEALKAELLERLLTHFYRHRPAVKPLVRHAELSTPLTTEHFVNPAAGGIYGVVSTPARYENPWLRPRTPVPGLFLSGCDVGAAGVMGAFVGGLLCAVAAEPAQALPWLRGALARR